MENEFKIHRNNSELYNAYHIVYKEIKQEKKNLEKLYKKSQKLIHSRKYVSILKQIDTLESDYKPKEKQHIQSNCSSIPLALELNRIKSECTKLEQELTNMKRPFQEEILNSKKRQLLLGTKLLVIEYKALGVSQAMYSFHSSLSPEEIKKKEEEIEHRRAEIREKFKNLNLNKGIYLKGEISRKCNCSFKKEIAETAKAVKAMVPSLSSAEKIHDKQALISPTIENLLHEKDLLEEK